MAEIRSKQDSLLETLAAHVGCRYLSDLRYLDGEQRQRLARRLETVEPETAALWEWNDALHYMIGDEKPRTNAALARTALIRGLRKS